MSGRKGKKANYPRVIKTFRSLEVSVDDNQADSSSNVDFDSRFAGFRPAGD